MPAGLNPLACLFWPTGRMFDSPNAENGLAENEDCIVCETSDATSPVEMTLDLNAAP